MTKGFKQALKPYVEIDRLVEIFFSVPAACYQSIAHTGGVQSHALPQAVSLTSQRNL